MVLYIEIRKATLQDARAINVLVGYYARRGKLLHRSLRDVKRSINSFFVALVDGSVVGCVCLDVYSRKMAEIRSLAVSPRYTGTGVGRRLVEKCVEKARKRKVLELMVITSEEAFFRKVGFDYILPGERKALFFNP